MGDYGHVWLADILVGEPLRSMRARHTIKCQAKTVGENSIPGVADWTGI